MEIKQTIKKYFGLSNWSIGNPMTVFVIIAIIVAAGLASYTSMPREDFPEVIEAKIYVNSLFPGNSAEDVEKLVTEPLEEELKNISGVTKITSTSLQDYSTIIVEFEDTYTPEQAKRKVKDQVDIVKADSDWPTLDAGAPVDPNVFDLNLSESMPIININLTGDYTKQRLKEFGEILEDKIEAVPEVKSVDILGVDDREVEVAVDLNKMTASNITLNDVIRAIQSENSTISGGNIVSNGLRRNIRVIGEIESPEELREIVVKNDDGTVYLRDIASVNFREKDKTTYARNYGDPVVMLTVMKKSGRNLLDANKQVVEIIEEAKLNSLPTSLNVEVTNDTSDRIRNQVAELENSIIFGVILVVFVLMFFLGFRNAIYVGIAIPLSMLMSFIGIKLLGLTLNTMTLFASVIGLGMLVDNGIVVVENVYRKLAEGMGKKEAARQGVGEIAWPIIASTATTLAAFLPLAFWPGIMGKFMKYFPITLSFVLGSSLFVALVVNSMLTSKFMSVKEGKLSTRSLIALSLSFIVLGALLLVAGRGLMEGADLFKGLGIITLLAGLGASFVGWLNRNNSRLLKIGFGILGLSIFFTVLSAVGSDGAYTGFGNLMVLMGLLLWVFKFIIAPLTDIFQHRFLPRLENAYKGLLSFALRGRFVPYLFFFGTFSLLIVAGVVFGLSKPNVLFFPENEANQAIVYIEYPEGTDIDKTNSLTSQIEKKVIDVVATYAETKNGVAYNKLVESVISQVGNGAGNPMTDGGNMSEMPHKGKVTVNFRQYKFREGLKTNDVLEEIRDAVQGYAGVSITAEKDAAGPPAGAPINIEIKGDNYDDLMAEALKVRDYINGLGIPGIEELKIDVNTTKPELEVYVDRKKAGDLGVSTSQVGQVLRQAIYGFDASTYKEGDDDYDIVVRLDSKSRYNENALFNQKITFRDNQGVLKTVPISAVASKRKTATFSSIKRKDLKRVISIYSNVLEGYNANNIVTTATTGLESYDLPSGISYKFTGEQEEQAKNMAFLSMALIIALVLIGLIIVAQFNSISKPMIIMAAVILSFIGVLFGLVIFKQDFVVIMTMMGIISLAGIVVNNAIVLIDYTQLMIDSKKEELGIGDGELLSRDEYRNAIVEGGKARLRPVLLTAITTIFGLLPLAYGLNINFFSLFTNYDPQIYIGGDNTIFWKPMCLTIIYGLTFATFLTLVIVPVMFFLLKRATLRFAGR